RRADGGFDRRCGNREADAGGTHPMTVLANTTFHAPHIDYKALSPLLATVGGSCIVLMVGLFRARFVQRTLTPLLTVASLAAAIALAIVNWKVGDTKPIVAGARARDALSLRTSHRLAVALLPLVPSL